MKEFEINKNDASQRLDKFLLKAFPLIPKSLMYKYIRKKRIKINGKRANAFDLLSVGDKIQLYINDELLGKRHDEYAFLNASLDLNIVYEDENIVVLNKPRGLLSHPEKGEYADSLIIRLQKYLYKKREFDPRGSMSFTPALANRLDRNTSGLVMAAKNAEALRVLNEKTKSREIQKIYICAVKGLMPRKKDVLKAYLEKDEKTNKAKVSFYKSEKSREIKTKYRVLDEKDGNSLLEIDLLTGRPHQIRAHMAAIGHPLLGDKKYDKESTQKDGQALCAYKLVFRFKTDAAILDYLKNKEITLDDKRFREDFFN